MGRRLLAALAPGLVLAFGPARAPAQSPPAAKSARPLPAKTQAAAGTPPGSAMVTDPGASVVMVRCGDGRGPQVALQEGRQGSGVVMAPGLVVTNAHVVSGGRSITVRHGGETWQARIRSIDPGRDLCLLSVPGLSRPPARAADPTRRVTGMAVQAIGYPGQRLQANKGRLTGVWHSQGGLLLQTDAPTSPGSSGGGLFDEEGRLLGLTTLVFEKTPAISFSLAVENLDYLLDLPPPGEILIPPGDLIPELVRSIAAHPENHPAWEAFTEDWVKLSPVDPEAWYARGCALHLRLLSGTQGRPGEALDEALWNTSVAAFRKATELGPSLAHAWNNLGSLLEMNNRFPESEAALRRALALAPDYTMAWINLAHTQFNARHFPDAAASYKTALIYRPFDGELWWSLGLAESMGAAPAEGLGHLAKAGELLPRHPQLWADIVRHRTRHGDRAGAAEALARLRELDPRLAEQVRAELRQR